MLTRYKPEHEEQLRQVSADASLAPHERKQRLQELMDDKEQWLGFQRYNVFIAAAEYHVQDAGTALSMLDLAIAQFKLKFPWLLNMLLQTDGGLAFHSSLFVIGAAYVAHHHGWRLLAFWHNSPGHGKDLVDRLFERKCKRAVRRMIAMGIDVPTGLHFVLTAASGAMRLVL